MGMERPGDRREALGRLECGGRSHQANISSCGSLSACFQMCSEDRVVIRRAQHGEAWLEEREKRNRGTCWRSALCNTEAQNKSYRRLQSHGPSCPATHRRPRHRGAWDCVSLTCCPHPAQPGGSSSVGLYVCTQRPGPLPHPLFPVLISAL